MTSAEPSIRDDIAAGEPVISVKHAARQPELKRHGRTCDMFALHRAIHKGWKSAAAGEFIRLEAVKRRRFTTMPAIMRFVARLDRRDAAQL